MKKISISLILVLIIFSTLGFADDTPTTEVTETTEVAETTNPESQNKLDNMKKSSVDTMIEYNPEAEGDKTLTEGVTDLERRLDYMRIVAERILHKNARILVVVISVFALIAFGILKAMRVKNMQKTALFFIIMPTVVYIVYSYLNPFLSTLE